MKIPLAHDFTCPWCWIGLHQAHRLEEQFGAEIEWLSYELMPDELEWSTPAPPTTPDPNRPPVPTRLELAYAAEGMEKPTAERPRRMRSHNAHEAVEFAREEGVANELVDRLYHAFWEEGQEINNPQVLAELAEGIVKDVPGMLRAIEERRFRDRIIGFDNPAYASGVYNVPTFYIDGERYGEQPYMVLEKAMLLQRV